MERRDVAVSLAVIGIIVFLVLNLSSGRVETILSNVGNSVTNDDSGGGQPGAGVAPTPIGGAVANGAGAPPGLLIIRTGRLELEVDDIGATLLRARDRVAALGGSVSQSEESSERDFAGATVTYRVPAVAWETALERLRDLAVRVRHQQTASEEVTGQVVDLDARIGNLRASESALRAIMALATEIPDVLEVQEKLTEVRGEIERLVAEKEHLEDRAAFGTLTVDYGLPIPPAVTKVQAGWDPAHDVDEATGTLIRAGQAAATALIWLAIVGVPVGLVGGTGLALGWWAFRLLRRRSAAA